LISSGDIASEMVSASGRIYVFSSRGYISFNYSYNKEISSSIFSSTLF